MAANHVVTINGKSFSIRLGWNAIRRIEEVLREPVQAIGLRMVNGQSGLRELGVVFWAGLETARINEKSRPDPYSLEEAGDIIDDFGPDAFFDQVYPQILLALTEAFPSVKAAKEQKEADAVKKRELDPPAAGSADGTGPAS